MGYGIVTTAFWGVVLPWDETEKLAQAIQQALTGSNEEAELDETESVKEDFSNLLVKLDPQIEMKKVYAVMVADGSDSRIENPDFEEGYDHGIGLLISEKGYGSHTTSEEFSKALNGDVSEQKALFEKLIQPLLDRVGIQAVAGVNVVSCTW